MPVEKTNIDPIEEKQLLILAAEGNARMFGKLVDAYWNDVYSHALAYFKLTELAEEMTQDLFAKIWRKREKLKEVNSFKNYLYIVSRNDFLKKLSGKTETPSLQLEEAWKWEDVYHAADSKMELAELEQLIQNGIGQLGNRQQEIFKLSRIEHLSHDEIALQLGLSPHTVKGHIVIALNFLRGYLKKHQIMLLLLAFLS